MSKILNLYSCGDVSHNGIFRWYKLSEGALKDACSLCGSSTLPDAHINLDLDSEALRSVDDLKAYLDHQPCAQAKNQADPFYIEYMKMGGKGWGLHLYNVSKALRDEIKSFVNYNVQWMDAPHKDVVKAVNPFFQSDSWFTNEDAGETGYLFIEMWAPTHAARLKFIQLLLDEVINKDRGVNGSRVYDVDYIPQGQRSLSVFQRAFGRLRVAPEDLASLLLND